jgi:hypothetical protein
MSALCQNQTSASYSITSSALDALARDGAQELGKLVIDRVEALHRAAIIVRRSRAISSCQSRANCRFVARS